MSKKVFFDLKKFKHVDSDDKSTTLQHPDGHSLTIAHKALSPEFREQLETLSKAAKSSKEEQRQPKKMAFGGAGDNREDAPPPPAEKPKQKLNPEPDLDRYKEDAERSKQNFEHPEKIKPMYDQGGQVLKRRAPPSDPDADYQKIAEQAKKNTEDPKNIKAIYKDGGRVQKYQMLADESPDSEDQNNKDINKEVEDSENFANRSENPNYIPPQQSEVPPAEQPSPYAEAYNNAYGQIKQYNPGLPDNMARQQALSVSEVKQDADKASTRNLVEDQQADHDKAVQENERRAQIGLPPLAVPAQPNIAPPEPPSNVPAVESSAPSQTAQPQSTQDMLGLGGAHDPESMLGAGFAQRMQGIGQQAQATGQLGQQQAELLNKNIENQQLAQSAFKNNYQELENERQAHMQDIKDGYIDPNKYWDNHSKVATGIGMILAGFNPTNSPNAAVNFLKYQMDQNMESQRQNLGAKQNLLSANLRQFGNLRDAVDMTRLMQHDIIANELQSAAAKAQSPMAKAAALQAAGQLQMDAAPMFQQFAMRRSMMNLAQNGASPGAIDHMLGYMRVVNPEMAKEMESRYVPGVGLANVPVPGEVRSQMIAKQQFNDAVTEMRQWATKHSGSLNPATIAEGKTKAANVQNLYRQGINGGVFKQGEQSFINGIVDADPTKFFNSIRVLPKLNEVIRENDNSLNILKQGYGLPAAKSSQQQSQPQFKMVNGIKYMRGPSGEAVKVK